LNKYREQQYKIDLLLFYTIKVITSPIRMSFENRDISYAINMRYAEEPSTELEFEEVIDAENNINKVSSFVNTYVREAYEWNTPSYDWDNPPQYDALIYPEFDSAEKMPMPGTMSHKDFMYNAICGLIEENQKLKQGDDQEMEPSKSAKCAEKILERWDEFEVMPINIPFVTLKRGSNSVAINYDDDGADDGTYSTHSSMPDLIPYDEAFDAEDGNLISSSMKNNDTVKKNHKCFVCSHMVEQNDNCCRVVVQDATYDNGCNI